jgi:nicotinate-nucleotide adenylyltransferase
MSLPKHVTGIIGGTFDPLHNGHLEIAQQLLTKLKLDQIEFIPCKQPTLGKQPIASAKQRVEMLHLGIKNNPKYSINTLELQRCGISYMIDTLKVLRARHPNDSLCLVIGSDVLETLNQWLHWEQLLTWAHIVVMTRSGHTASQAPWLKEYLEKHQTFTSKTLFENNSGSLYCFSSNIPAISSTHIREQLRKQVNEVDILPKSVLDYIKQQCLYQS